MPPIKPGRWSVNPADIDPSYLNYWRDLAFCVPLLEGGGRPTEIVSKTAADSVTNLAWRPGEYGAAVESSTAGFITWTTFPQGAFAVNQGTSDPSLTVAVLCRPITGRDTNPNPFSYTDTGGPQGTNGTWGVRISDAGFEDWWFYWRSAGTTIDLTSSVQMPDNDIWQLVVVTRSPGGDYRFYQDGQFTALVSDATAWDTTNVLGLVIHSADSNFSSLFGDVALVAGWDRVLGADEVRQLWLDPFGFLRPRVEPLFGQLTASATLATGDGSKFDVVNEEDTETDLWDSVKDNPSTPDDTDWINQGRPL